MASQLRRCIVDETVLLVMRISRWFGLAPVRFTKSRDKTFMYISRTFFIYGLIFVVVLDIVLFFATYFDQKSPIIDKNQIKDLENISIVFKICDTLLSIGLVTLAAINATRKTKTSMYCIESVRKIKCNILGGSQDNVLKWKILSVTVLFVFGTWMFKAVDIWRYSVCKKTENKIQIPLFLNLVADLQIDTTLLFLTVLFMMELQFVVIALHIKSGFQAVNECLRNVISNLEQENCTNYMKPIFLKIPVKSINVAIDLLGMTDQRYPDTVVEKRLALSHKVREISQSYVGVCNVLRKFNDSESTTIFFQLTNLALHLLITVFNLVKVVHLHGNVNSKPDLLALQCTWIVYHILKMILLVEPCCRTEEEVANTRILVGKLMCHITTEVDPLQDETEAFYNHILLNEVSYAVFGLFSLGRPLISKVYGIFYFCWAKIIGGATTILVLLF